MLVYCGVCDVVNFGHRRGKNEPFFEVRQVIHDSK